MIRQIVPLFFTMDIPGTLAYYKAKLGFKCLGTWHIGYGDKFDEAKLKALPPGSFYTEPSARNHFAETGVEPVVVQITGFGPSSTEYVDPNQDPRKSGKSN